MIIHPKPKRIPVRLLVIVQYVLAAIRIVHIQHAGLGKNVGPTAADRMFRVAFNLDRATVIARNQKSVRYATKFHRTGIELGNTGQDAGRTVCEGGDLLLRPPTTAGKPHAGQGHRSAHDLEEVSAISTVEKLRSSGGKFAMHELPELGGVCKLIKTAPVFFAGR